MKRESLIGRTFGKWKVVGWDSPRGKWTTICECGRWGKHTRTVLEREESTQCMKCYTQRVAINESAFNSVWNDYIQQAKRRNRAWTLTKEEAKGLFSQSCFYCGDPPSSIRTIPNGRGSFTSNGIDRVDNDLDYVYSNCRACCKTCNFMKRSMSMENFFAHIQKIVNKRKLL